MDQQLTQSQISFLSVGTKLLLRDTMDQFLRTEGEHKTLHSSTMQAALRVFSEHTVHILFTEVSLEDGSAYRLLKHLGGNNDEEDVYFVLALEEQSPAHAALAEELEVHDIIVKPISGNAIKALVSRYVAWKAMPKEPWQLLIQEASLAMRDSRYADVEAAYAQIPKVAAGSPKAFYKAGRYYLKKANLKLAQEMFEQAVKIKEDCVPALDGLALVHIQKGNIAQGREYYEKAASASPLNPDRLCEILRLHLKQNLELGRQVRLLEQENVWGRVHFAKLMFIEKNYTGAVKEFEAVLPHVTEASVRTEIHVYIAAAKKLSGLSSL